MRKFKAPLNDGPFDVSPRLLDEAQARGHDFRGRLFAWENGTNPIRHHLLLVDGEVAAVAYEAGTDGWIASDYGGSPVNLRPVTQDRAADLAVRSALLLFTVTRPKG